MGSEMCIRDSTSARLSVKPVSKCAEKLPFVVAKVDDAGTFVMARGLAWAKVNGPVEPGDILVASRRSLHVEKDNRNSDPSRSMGVAVSQRVGDKVLVRIARIGNKSTKGGSSSERREE